MDHLWQHLLHLRDRQVNMDGNVAQLDGGIQFGDAAQILLQHGVIQRPEIGPHSDVVLQLVFVLLERILKLSQRMFVKAMTPPTWCRCPGPSR